jgi:hypothetical protein
MSILPVATPVPTASFDAMQSRDKQGRFRKHPSTTQPRNDNGQFKPRYTPNFLQRGVANSLRTVGDGYGRTGAVASAVGDQLYIYPTESLMAVGELAKMGTAGIPVVGKLTAKVSTGVSFLSAFNNLIFSMMVRQPSDFVNNATHALADSIDGGNTYNGAAGGLMFAGNDAMSMAAAMAQQQK